jgi:membrane-associated protein
VTELPALSHRLRRGLLIGAGALVLLVAAVAVLNRVGGDDAFGALHGGGVWAYVTIFAMVFGDAVCPVLPGETTLNAASTLAAAGSLDLSLVIVAGAAGAIVGDSALYWMARLGKRRFRAQVEKVEKDERVALALSFMGGNAPLLIVAGRYVPGLRFVVNATMGVTEYPYRRFIVWSALGGALWSAYTCALAYLIATALSGFPLASIVISGVVTTAAVAVVILRMRAARKRAGEGQPTITEASTPSSTSFSTRDAGTGSENR